MSVTVQTGGVREDSVGMSIRKAPECSDAGTGCALPPER
jgi:hypothetical protein